MATFPFMVDTNLSVLLSCAARAQLTAMLDGYLKVLRNTIFSFGSQAAATVLHYFAQLSQIKSTPLPKCSNSWSLSPI